WTESENRNTMNQSRTSSGLRPLSTSVSLFQTTGNGHDSTRFHGVSNDASRRPGALNLRERGAPGAAPGTRHVGGFVFDIEWAQPVHQTELPMDPMTWI